MTYLAPEPIDPRFVASEFDCGEKALNRWLVRHAVGNEATGRSRTFVVREKDDLRIAAFYCLSTAVAQYTEASDHAVDSMPKNEPIPAVLLGRLAVDLKHQGRGMGTALLRDAIQRTRDIATNAGVRLMLVHAKNEAMRSFYTRWGFEQSPTDELQLMLLMQDVQRS